MGQVVRHRARLHSVKGGRFRFFMVGNNVLKRCPFALLRALTQNEKGLLTKLQDSIMLTF